MKPGRRMAKFVIDANSKTAHAINPQTFANIGAKERHDLQNWIINEPTILGEELLIVAEEFSGWDTTAERLDLLALDKQGNLVVIENKTDDSGKDVTWQALKYASYCAAFTKGDILQVFERRSKNAKEEISNFFDGKELEELELNLSVRVILVAANFRNEVTSTVIFLREFGLDVSCVKISLYSDNGRLYLGSERILPVKELEEYQVKLAVKKREEKKEQKRHPLREKFWEYALPILREKTGIYQNVSPKRDNWLQGASGHSGVSYNVIAKYNGARAELYINTGDRSKNKKIFNELHNQASGLLENAVWREMPENNTSIVCINFDQFGITDEENWRSIADFLANSVCELKQAFDEPLKNIMKGMKE